ALLEAQVTLEPARERVAARARPLEEAIVDLLLDLVEHGGEARPIVEIVGHRSSSGLRTQRRCCNRCADPSSANARGCVSASVSSRTHPRALALEGSAHRLQQRRCVLKPLEETDALTHQDRL